MSVNEKMTAIADAIRDKTGRSDLLTLDNMALGIEDVYVTGRENGHAEGYNIGWDSGYAVGLEGGHEAGVAEGTAQCEAKHFVTTVFGKGETSISFPIPFEPDFLAIFCGDSDIWGATTPTVYGATFDIAAFGLIAGIMFVSNSGGFSNNALSTETYKLRYSRAEDGTVTIGNLGPPGGTGKFKSSRPYMVCAVKYVGQTDKERITEYVRSLTGSGSVTLNKAKVNAAFTDAEWAALIDEKPSYTFNFV